jgi:hypothetical protein
MLHQRKRKSSISILQLVTAGDKWKFNSKKRKTDSIPTPQAARYNSAGEPNPPAPTTKIEDFNRFDWPESQREKKKKTLILTRNVVWN